MSISITKENQEKRKKTIVYAESGRKAKSEVHSANMQLEGTWKARARLADNRFLRCGSGNAEALPKDAVPPEIIKYLPLDGLQDKIQMQKSATPVPIARQLQELINHFKI